MEWLWSGSMINETIVTARGIRISLDYKLYVHSYSTTVVPMKGHRQYEAQSLVCQETIINLQKVPMTLQ